MKVIGFLLALLLAWPTFGLSIVVYFAAVAVSGYMKGKMSKQFADEREVRQVLDTSLTRKLPSWFKNHDEVNTFVRAVNQMAQHKGIPAIYVKELMGTKEFFGVVMNFAAEMEARGNSRTAQQLSAVNLVMESYHRLTAENQAKLSLMQLNENLGKKPA